MGNLYKLKTRAQRGFHNYIGTIGQVPEFWIGEIKNPKQLHDCFCQAVITLIKTNLSYSKRFPAGIRRSMRGISLPFVEAEFTSMLLWDNYPTYCLNVCSVRLLFLYYHF